MRTARTCLTLCLLLLALPLLAACSSAPVKHVFPPRASIQQLTIQADGSWKLQLRLQNYSSISETFSHVDAQVQVAGTAAGSVNAPTNLRIGPESADIVDTVMTPTPPARQAVASLHSGNIRYKLAGHIATSDPLGDHEYSFDGVLSPVPGLQGVLR